MEATPTPLPALEPALTPTRTKRLTSLDTYRGFVMFLMVAEVLHLSRMARNFPTSGFWEFLAYHQSHVPWIGCSLHDLIQPSFSFMVGVALPFSIASRLARGQSPRRLTAHAFWRAFVLVFLGVFLRSLHSAQTRFTFEDTLSQIGLGYGFLFLLGFRRMRVQWLALAVILIGYWGAFALYRVPGPDFDYQTVGVANDWEHLGTGFAAHWDKNTNLAADFETWFLNLFPRERPFEYNGGGYLTLSFIPTLGTMILGLIAGGILKGERSGGIKFLWLILAGAAGIGLGWAMNHFGVCPLVKRIWTPSWTLYSGGWCFLILAGLYLVIDVIGLRRWAFPLVVIGMNSIAIYCMSWTIEGFVGDTLRRHLGEGIFQIFGENYQTLLSGGAVILVFWLILFWMYRRKLFLRI